MAGRFVRGEEIEGSTPFTLTSKNTLQHNSYFLLMKLHCVAIIGVLYCSLPVVGNLQRLSRSRSDESVIFR